MISQLCGIIINLVGENLVLQEQLALLKAKRFGKSSEKLDKQIADLELRVEEAESQIPEVEIEEATSAHTVETSDAADDTSAKKPKPKRQKLPDDLPRIDIVLNPESVCPSCGGSEFRKISEDVSETLDYIPASWKVNRYIRPRCACIACEQIVQAHPHAKAIDKGKAGSGLLSHILVQKYCNHLPLYRQSAIYEREGIAISRSTMAGWAGQSAILLEPIIDEIRRIVFSADQIHGDDTPVKVLAPGLGKTKTGRIWSYVKDGRGYGDKSPPAVCYFYSPDRKGERPLEHLRDFAGVLHADAYVGYDALYRGGKNPDAKITEAACWAHMRRKFYEVTVASDNASIAEEVLEKISEIYQIEARIKGMPPSQRLAARVEQSKKLVEDLFGNFKRRYKQLPAKSATAKAIAYAMNHSLALMRFLENGQIEIDNNAAERAMRSIALGRKNWLFAGSDKGGDTAAAIYTLIETAKLNGVNPWKYLKKVFDIIQDHPINKIADLLPWNLNLDST